MLSSWLRAIRIRFLLASVIAVSVGLAVSWWKFQQFDPFYALLTYLGVACLHASVDLLNDYWDYKRGIDKLTKRTPFSGGTGVLPENLIQPSTIYTVGLVFLALGTSIGIYLVFLRGFTIAIILAFAVLSIYFYSTSIVNAGLGELFVTIKGVMIVLGTFFVQTAQIIPNALYVGVIVGLLSASVLFVNSFADHDADKSKGRKTLVIVLGMKKASTFFTFFPSIVYALIAVGIILNMLPIYSLICCAAVPLAIRIGRTLKKDNNDTKSLVPAMSSAVTFSRLVGVLLVLSFLI
ncbi:MAG: prenyltransferase [Nitrososphaerales archaeon]